MILTVVGGMYIVCRTAYSNTPPCTKCKRLTQQPYALLNSVKPIPMQVCIGSQSTLFVKESMIPQAEGEKIVFSFLNVEECPVFFKSNMKKMTSFHK